MLPNPVTPPSSPPPKHKQVLSPQKPSRQVFNRFKENSTKTAFQLKRKWSNEPLLREAIQTQIDPDSPVKKIGTPDNSPSKFARSVITNSGAKLNIAFITEKFAVYAANSNLRNEFSGEELKIILNTLFDGVDTIPNLPNIEPDSKKIQAVKVTLEQRNSAEKKNYRDQSRAITNNHGQVRANKDIADIYFTEKKLNKVANKLGFDKEKTERLKNQFLNFEAEWLHLVDYANIGEEGQCPENLVFGTWEANSQMIVVEEYINRILNKNFTAEITVEASICKLHIPYEINYLLFIPELQSTIRIPINPFTREQPLPELIKYLALVEKIVKEKQHVQNPLMDAEGKQPAPKINSSTAKDLFGIFAGNKKQEVKGENDKLEQEVKGENDNFKAADLVPVNKIMLLN